MSEAVKIQDPAEVLDYSFDWSAWLATDSISGSVWTVSPAGPTVSGNQIAGAVTTCFLSGLAFAGLYRLLNTVTTAQGRTAERAITVRCFPG